MNMNQKILQSARTENREQNEWEKGRREAKLGQNLHFCHTENCVGISTVLSVIEQISAITMPVSQ